MTTKVTITHIEIDKAQIGYIYSVWFEFYTERQFTKEEHKITSLTSCDTVSACIKKIKQDIKKYVFNNRTEFWTIIRKQNGWL